MTCIEGCVLFRGAGGRAVTGLLSASLPRRAVPPGIVGGGGPEEGLGGSRVANRGMGSEPLALIWTPPFTVITGSTCTCSQMSGCADERSSDHSAWHSLSVARWQPFQAVKHGWLPSLS